MMLWEKFAPFADRSFSQEFALNPHQRFWEMYLGSRLLDIGFELQPRASDKGPDFHLIIDNSNVWIEATAPSEGVGVDSVPTLMEHSRFDPIPEEKIILRFTNTISEKKGKLLQYQQDGTVQPDDAFLIGICGGRIQLIQFDAPMPSVIKSVYPIGEPKVKIDTMRMEIVEERYESRHEILKVFGSQVSTDSFVDPSYSGISGILYSDTTMINLPNDPDSKFLFVHNYLASVPMRKGWLKIGKDCWVDGNSLYIVQNKRCA